MCYDNDLSRTRRKVPDSRSVQSIKPEYVPTSHSDQAGPKNAAQATLQDHHVHHGRPLYVQEPCGVWAPTKHSLCIWRYACKEEEGFLVVKHVLFKNFSYNKAVWFFVVSMLNLGFAVKVISGEASEVSWAFAVPRQAVNHTLVRQLITSWMNIDCPH